MAMQTADNRLAQLSHSPSHSGKSGTAAPLLAAACLLAGVIALGVLGQREPGPGASQAGGDDNGAWMVGP